MSFKLRLTHLPVVILVFSSLHTHLPRPQRLRQTPRQTRRPAAIRLVRRVSPTSTTTCPHTHSTISRRRRWRGFSARSRSFWWCRRHWFRFCGRNAGGGAIDTVGGCRRRRCRNHTGNRLRRSWRRDGLGVVFCEVSGRHPALSGAVELFGKPPTWEVY